MLSTSRHALCIYSRLCLRVKVAHSLSVSASNLLVSHCSVTVARSLLACRASRWLGVRLPRDEDQRRWVPGGCSQAPPTLRLPAHRQGPAAVWHAGTCKLVCWLMCSLTPRLTCCLGVSQHMHPLRACVRIREQVWGLNWCVQRAARPWGEQDWIAFSCSQEEGLCTCTLPCIPLHVTVRVLSLGFCSFLFQAL